ncbi:hypothetical protein RJ640_008792 [Escallonia rubra]|uniref:MULE transposase domain-containing protein n=1 Tax=Escallonia rubra TaxID=112253 RepID=A0AA88QKF3_9ASTE|nr:hypothetical protein RJ640_008792 [Escallonia rubra]
MGFKDQASQDPSFFYAFQLDNEEQITNIFWADGRMRMDYELFGDIVTFDTTFATNKDHRPLGVFIGFNHYREQVIFGASLLYDETQASFDWVFSTFFEAHNFKKPTTVFTDQDISMGNAISVVMPEVLDVLGIKYILETYILKRWTRGVRDGCALEEDGLDVHRSGALDVSDRYRELWPDVVRLAHKASEFKDGYLIYKSKMKELRKEIKELRKKHYECTDHGCEPNGNKGVDKNAIESLVGNCLEPPQVSTWSNFDHDNVEKDMCGPRFTEMLSAGLDDTLLSSLSQGSNRAQFNGKKVMGEFNMLGSNHIQSGGERGERVFGDLNVLSSQTSTTLGSHIFK